MESKVLELVVFKLVAGVSREEFLGAAGGLSDWAGRQPGFISRELSHDAEGDRWIEVVWWRTMADAKAAAENAMSSESCARMFALIDMESAEMIHAEPAIDLVLAAPTAARA
jgi:hypothetical protein